MRPLPSLRQGPEPPPDPPSAPCSRRHLFVVEGVDAADLLVRVLGPFAVHQARLTDVRFAGSDGRATARVEVEGLSWRSAEHLRRRLEQLPLVTGVTIGWRD